MYVPYHLKKESQPGSHVARAKLEGICHKRNNNLILPSARSADKHQAGWPTLISLVIITEKPQLWITSGFSSGCGSWNICSSALTAAFYYLCGAVCTVPSFPINWRLTSKQTEPSYSILGLWECFSLQWINLGIIMVIPWFTWVWCLVIKVKHISWHAALGSFTCTAIINHTVHL